MIEKDFYVTKAISLLKELKSNVFKLVFQGGTALAKAHRLVQRMSEGCDFRLVLIDQKLLKNRTALRSELKKFRASLISCLKEGEFLIDKSSVFVRNEGRFITIEARYDPICSVSNVLKPYILFEFFFGTVKRPVDSLGVTSLINQTVEMALPPGMIQIDCMSVLETAVEKWVALVRRVAMIKEREYYYKQALVRHLYDLYMIHHNVSLDKKQFIVLVSIILEEDRKQFTMHSELYANSTRKANFIRCHN